MLNWNFINGFGTLLELGMRKSAALGALQVRKEMTLRGRTIHLADTVPPVIPQGALNYMRINAFQIAHVENQELLNAVKGKLSDTLKGGGTLADFKRDLPGMFNAAGVTPLDNFHTQTVFQTNLQSAYQAGRYWGIMDSSADIFPFVQYHTANDDKVRPAHRALEGAIFKRDDPILNRIWPPNGYNCRCTMTAISKYEAGADNLEPTPVNDLVDPQTQAPYRADPGFDTNPALSPSINKWWTEKMGADFVATPETYGLGAVADSTIAPQPAPVQTDTAPNFEGTPITMGSDTSAAAYDTVRAPAEVWSVPGEKAHMRQIKRYGDHVVMLDIVDGRVVDSKTLTVAEAEKYRKGVLVYLR